MKNNEFKPVEHKHDSFMNEALKKPGFKKAYEALGEEFNITRACIKARKKANLTQEEVAGIMQTSRTTVSRIESPSSKFMPSLTTLIKYAHALNCEIELKFKPLDK